MTTYLASLSSGKGSLHMDKVVLTGPHPIEVDEDLADYLRAAYPDTVTVIEKRTQREASKEALEHEKEHHRSNEKTGEAAIGSGAREKTPGNEVKK